MVWELVLFIAACTVVTVGCLVPNGWLPPLPNDKLMHFVGFGGIAALALPLASNRLEGAWILIGVLLASAVIECLQNLLPDRRFCWRDIAANACGIGFVAVCALLYGAI